MTRGFIGILTVDLHLPDSHSLKEKRGGVKPIIAALQHRHGAAVAEVDHHDLWQRARITATVVAREYSEASRRVDAMVRYVESHAETVQIEQSLVVAAEEIAA